MGLFGKSADAPDLRPYLDMAQQSVTNAEGKMSYYDGVIQGFTNLGLEGYQESQALFGPWQERMNDIYLNTTAQSYETKKGESYRSELSRFNKKSSDAFFAAGIPRGTSVGQQRGLSQDIAAAEYSAQNNFESKHQVAQIHEQAMQTGDEATKLAFNQLQGGVNLQQGVSDMWANNAANEQSNIMSQASISAQSSWASTERQLSNDAAMWGGVGQAAGAGIGAGMAGTFSQSSNLNSNAINSINNNSSAYANADFSNVSAGSLGTNPGWFM